MPYVEPRIDWAGKQYFILKKEDGPAIVEAERVEEALGQGAQYYPLANHPDYEGWVEIPESHFKKLEENECLNQIILALEQMECSEPSKKPEISCSL